MVPMDTHKYTTVVSSRKKPAKRLEVICVNTVHIFSFLRLAQKIYRSIKCREIKIPSVATSFLIIEAVETHISLLQFFCTITEGSDILILVVTITSISGVNTRPFTFFKSLGLYFKYS